MIQCRFRYNDVPRIMRNIIKLQPNTSVEEMISKLGDLLSPNFDFTYDSADLVVDDVSKYFGMAINELAAMPIPDGVSPEVREQLMGEKNYFRELARRYLTDLDSYIQQYQASISNFNNTEIITSVDTKKEIKDIQGSDAMIQTNENGSEYIPDPTEDYSDAPDDSSLIESQNLNELYGTAMLVNLAMQENFKRDIIGATFINLKTGTLTRDIEQLNKNINSYKNNLVKSIISYLNSLGKNINYKTAYLNKNKPNNGYLNRLFNLSKEAFKDVNSSTLEVAFGEQNNIKSQLFLNAYNAYAILNNFDEMVTKILPNVLSINQKKDYTQNRYFIQINNNLVSTWRTSENVNAIDEVGNLSKLLIEITPYKTFEGEPVFNRNLKVNEFMQTFAKLKIESISSLFTKNLPKLVRLNPMENLKSSIEYVLQNRPDFQDVFTQGDFNIFRSVYDMFFKEKHKNGENYSIYQVMLKEQSNELPIYNLNILETILATIDRVEKANYIQYSKPFNENDISIRNILDSGQNTIKLHLENNINITNRNVTEEACLDLRQKYRVTTNGLTIDDTIEFEIPGIEGRFRSNMSEEITFNDKPIDGLFELIKSANFREILDNPTNERELNTIQALRFVDDLLKTYFTKGDESLLYTYIDMIQDKDNYLSGLLNVAAKILWNNELYLYTNDNNLPMDEAIETTALFNNQSKTRDTSYFYDRKNKALKAFTNSGLVVLDALARAESIQRGESYKNNTKDLSGNLTPTTRMPNLIKNIPAQIEISKKTPLAFNVLNNNLFFKNVNIIDGTEITAGGQSVDGEITKKSSSFNIAEIGYTSLVHDFLESFYTSNKYYVQPTTYSDKSSHYKLVINTDKLIRGIVNPLTGSTFGEVSLKNATHEQLHELNFATMYNTYQTLQSNLIEDYKNAFRMLPEERAIELGVTTNVINNLTWEVTKDIMSKVSKSEYETLAREARRNGLKSDFIEEVHWSGNALGDSGSGVNALIDYYINLYSIKEGKSNRLMDRVSDLYTERMVRGQRKLVRTMLNNNITLDFIKSDGEVNDVLSAIKNNQDTDFKNNWVNNDLGRIIIAKYKGQEINSLNYKEILTDKNIRDIKEDIKINPLIIKYFDHNTLIANNFNTAIVGPAYAHPAKGNANPTTDEVTSLVESSELGESLRQLAQFKRMVILPATLHTYLQRTIQGIPTKYRIAVMDDINVGVNNFTGATDKVTAHDGGAWANPIIAVLENLSLQDSAAGMDKKPIGHSYNAYYGTASLLKFALFAIDNERIRTSGGSRIQFKNMLRKMLDIDWTIPVLNLMQDYNGNEQSLANILRERVFYKSGNKFMEVTSMTSNGNNLYTLTKREVDNRGNAIGNEYQSTYSINTNFKLWEALGGENSLSLNGTLENSNASIEHTVKFVNSVGIKRTQENADLYNHDLGLDEYGEYHTNQYIDRSLNSQNTIYQPLKHSMIAYLVNKSAIKNGSTNINSTDTYTNSEPLSTMELDTYNLGIQLDSDHEADESELTEMSQVVSALEELGYTHKLSTETYKSIAGVVERTIEPLLDAVAQAQIGNRTEAYNIVATALIKAHSTKSNSVGLAERIMENITQEFLQRKENPEYKVPFSDPNIFSSAISTITSNVTKSSIRRKYPGIASILVPSYDIIQLFYNGFSNVKYDELTPTRLRLTDEELEANPELKEQASTNFGNWTQATLQPDGSYNKPLELNAFNDINEYAAYLLEYERKSNELIDQRNNFTSDGDYSNYINEEIQKDDKLRNLLNMSYNSPSLKYNQLEFQESYLVFDGVGNELETVTLDSYQKYQSYRKNNLFTFKRAYHVPQNLKSARVSFIIGDGTYSIFDTNHVRDMFLGNNSLENRKAVQATFEQIKNGWVNTPTILIEDIKNGVTSPDNIQIIRNGEELQFSDLYLNYLESDDLSIFNNTQVKINSVSVKEAELVLPKIYKTQFGLRTGDTINSVRQLKSKFFYNRMKENNVNTTSNYDVVLKRGNGNHVYVLFEGSRDTDQFTDADIEVETRGDKVVRLNEVGEVMYTLDNLRVMNDENDVEILVIDNPSKLIELYSSEKFDLVDFNINSSKFGQIKTFLNSNIDKRITKLNAQIDTSILRVNGDLERGFKNNLKGKAVWQEEMMQESALMKYASFERSLEFVAARIPSQAMQSFMAMKVTEFTDNEKNVAYVSHYQIWLQGSDFDIDKVFLMGSEFDDNGIYIGWSPLFNYSSFNNLKESEKLPIPNGLNYNIVPTFIEGAIDITDDIINMIVNNSVPTHADGTNSNVTMMAELLSKIDSPQAFNRDGSAILYIDPTRISSLTDNMGIHINNITDVINNHNQYLPTGQNSVRQFKNSVSSKIYRIINDLSNFVSGYSPVEMDAPRNAAKTSLSGNESRTLLIDNPSTNWIMQFQNMSGKEVIGIAAVGEKVFFALSNYFNEGVGNPDWFENMIFQKTFRFNGRTITRNTIANINFQEYANAMRYWSRAIEETLASTRTDEMDNNTFNALLTEAISTQISGNQSDASLIISAVLSAATDNAKELILSKINAGADFASIYIYAIILGIDFDVIADFMKSPTIQTLGELIKGNIFNDTKPNIDVKNLIEYFRDGIWSDKMFNDPKIIGNNMFISALSNVSEQKLKSTIINFVTQKEFDQVPKKSRTLVFLDYLNTITDKDSELKDQLSRALNIIGRNNRFGENTKIRVNRILETMKYYNYLRNNIINRDDINLFDKLSKLADEIKDLGAIFKVNQGLPTTLQGLYGYQQRIEQAVVKRSKELIVLDKTNQVMFLETYERIIEDKPYLDKVSQESIKRILTKATDLNIIKNFNFDRFASDLEYKDTAIKYYNLIKGTFNVLDIIDKVPHFKAMIKAFTVSKDLMSSVSEKFRLFQTLAKTYASTYMYNGGNVYPITLNDETLSAISEYLNEVVTSKWLRNLDKEVYVEAGNRIFSRTGELLPKLESDFSLDLGTDYGQASFKYWFEQTVINNLRNGRVDQGLKLDVAENKFIQGLKITTRNAQFGNLVEHLKLDINLTNLTTDFDKYRYQTFLSDFKKLDRYSINGVPITELIFLYNIIINKNKYGPNNLTKLFEDYIQLSDNNIINDYLKYVGEMDSNMTLIEDQDYSIRDMLLKVAPTVDSGSLSYRRYKYVKVYNRKSKMFDVYENKATSGKVDFNRLNNLNESMLNYFTTLTPNFSYIFKSDLNNLNKSELISNLKRLISTNQLQMLLDCE